MKTSIPVFIFILLASCSARERLDINSIRILQSNRQPLFIDHDRILQVVDKDCRSIDDIGLYPDSGNGCNSFLFDDGDKYMLIDCNGQWISIDKRTGDINVEGWKWRKALPPKHLGVFQRRDNDNSYEFIAKDYISLEDVYKFKDPDD